MAPPARSYGAILDPGPRLRPLQLTMLQLAQQTFTKIESLEHLPHLESLWLVENNIERIQGLQACVKLR